MTKFFVRQGTQLGEDLISFRLNTESVWKQENYKILWSMQKRHSRGAPNDLKYGRGSLISESVWKQENYKILWLSKKRH